METPWTLPGTTILCDRQADTSIILDGLFSAGGLVLSQVSALTGLEGYVIQNWIRRGFTTSPQKKLYSKRQFCRLVIIGLLKDSLSISEAVDLIASLNGQLDDERDDLVDDSSLYIWFTRSLKLCEEKPEKAKEAACRVLDGEKTIAPALRERLTEVLEVLCFAYASSVYRKSARELAKKIPASNVGLNQTEKA